MPTDIPLTPEAAACRVSYESTPTHHLMEDPNNATPKWITDRPPTIDDIDDSDMHGYVAVSVRHGVNGHFAYVLWQCVHPGTPWAPIGAVPASAFDPTTLDRNGWIRSRLPREWDMDEGGDVKAPWGPGDWMWASAAYIVPGQPWAPADSVPGEYQP